MPTAVAEEPRLTEADDKPHEEHAPGAPAELPPPVEPDQTITPMPPHPQVLPTLNPQPAPPAIAPVPFNVEEKLAAFYREQNQPVELPDGSLRVNVVVAAEMVPVLQSWAEDAGESFDVFLNRHLTTCLYAGTMAGSSW